MNEINSAENIFLGKLEVLLQKFDELDNISNEIKEIIDKEPDKQSQLDMLLSDYYHKLENDDLSDIEILNIGKKIHEVRLQRRDENRVSSLIACYEKNKHKLQYSVKGNRDMFRQQIKLTKKSLHNEYKYRVLKDNDFDDLKKCSDNIIIEENKEQQQKRKKRGKGITKEQLEECLSKGMTTVAIAKLYDKKQPYISLLKKKYGFKKNNKE